MSPGASGWGGAVLPSLKHRGFCTLPFQARLRFVGRYLPCVASLIIGFCLAPPALFLLPGVAPQTRCSDGNERPFRQGLTVTRPAESCRMARIAHKRVVHRVVSRPLVNARFTFALFSTILQSPTPAHTRHPAPPLRWVRLLSGLLFTCRLFAWPRPPGPGPFTVHDCWRPCGVDRFCFSGQGANGGRREEV